MDTDISVQRQEHGGTGTGEWQVTTTPMEGKEKRREGGVVMIFAQ